MNVWDTIQEAAVLDKASKQASKKERKKKEKGKKKKTAVFISLCLLSINVL